MLWGLPGGLPLNLACSFSPIVLPRPARHCLCLSLCLSAPLPLPLPQSLSAADSTVEFLTDRSS